MQTNILKLFSFKELIAIAALAFLAFGYVESAGAFSRHMIIHIALMTAAAPVLASLLQKLRSPGTKSASAATLPAAITLQAALFFAWHSPPGVSLAMEGLSGALLMQATLLFSALWFWLTIFNQTEKHLWRAVIALLLTGKLFCLIAVLLTFAPRVLYDMTAVNTSMNIELADQQLAGLLMITICPLTYVLAAIVLIFRWFQTLCESQSNIASSAFAPENNSWQSR
jgi:putative membrane protein